MKKLMLGHEYTFKITLECLINLDNIFLLIYTSLNICLSLLIIIFWNYHSLNVLQSW
jgi:hypothetical protein